MPAFNGLLQQSLTSYLLISAISSRIWTSATGASNTSPSCEACDAAKDSLEAIEERRAGPWFRGKAAGCVVIINHVSSLSSAGKLGGSKLSAASKCGAAVVAGALSSFTRRRRVDVSFRSIDVAAGVDHKQRHDGTRRGTAKRWTATVGARS